MSLSCLSQVQGLVSQWLRYRQIIYPGVPSFRRPTRIPLCCSFLPSLDLTSLDLPFFYLVSSSHFPPCLDFSFSSSPSYLSLLPLFFSPSFTLQPFLFLVTFLRLFTLYSSFSLPDTLLSDSSSFLATGHSAPSYTLTFS